MSKRYVDMFNKFKESGIICVCGFEHGFHSIVPANANTTVDNEFMTAEQSYKYHNEFMWNGRYAECISMKETIKRMRI